ncbi:YjeF N-terminal domain-like protein [Rhizodiscina lignyota]|uniref:Enhancer of mRNA-decapping protein 3 n=1 Tax=Rhizodiscina lignyota TaxID=1504668 RepID=A0A9P4IJM4_9PEZI|nr:YjeF N-terminal domain-like protein [Rhizodiscina lignyota]
MASQYIGVAVLITLRNPSNIQVQGVVANIIPDSQTLILRDVLFPADGRRMPTCSVEGAQIADIRLVENPPLPPQQSAQPPVPSLQTNQVAAAQSQPVSAAATPTQASQPFVDPAIVSMGKRPSIQSTRSSFQTGPPFPASVQEAPATPMKPAAAAVPPPKRSAHVGASNHPTGPRNAAATLTAPFSGLDIGDNAETLDDSEEPTIVDNGVRRVSITKTRTGKPMDGPSEMPHKKSGRNKRNKKRQEQGSQDFGVPESSPEAVRKGTNASTQYRGKGWRQTPILREASEPISSKTPGVITGNVGQAAIKSSRRMQNHQRKLEAQQNGWATEDATDIQEMPEFDFQSNLNKFDKRAVFDQIRNEDTTADDERLVSFNRLPARPGTHGGKNLHPTENVLSSQNVKNASKRSSQTDTSSDEFDFDSARNSRTMSRASSKRGPLRSNSNLADETLPTRSRSSITGLGVPRTAYSSHSHSHGSPNIGSSTHFTPPTSPPVERGPPHQAPTQSHFLLSHSGRTCPTITPGGMLAVEELAEVEFGIPPGILTENAGRGIAEVMLAALNPGGLRLARENVALNARPVCIVLAGNHKAGARAVAASRHLSGRGVKVMVCVLEFDKVHTGSGMELDRELKVQLDIVRKLGGTVKSWADVKRWLHGGEAPVEGVLDALLPLGKTFEELGPYQDDAMEMVVWVNSGTGKVVVSVDVPSGVNGSTGETNYDALNAGPFAIKAKHIACVGAPRIGLLRALQRASNPASGEPRPDWSLWAIDIGINKAWKQFGSVGGRGVRFGGEWVAPITFVSGEA